MAQRIVLGNQRGVALLGLIIAVAVMGISMAVTGVVWEQAQRREKETELLFVGKQYQLAIRQYYESSPGIKRYPASLDDLLRDTRFAGTRRYLRKRYADPIAPQNEWGLIRSHQGGIMGVYSTASGIPIHQAEILPDQEPKTATSYQDWRFEWRPLVDIGNGN